MLEVRAPSYTGEGVEACVVCHAGDFNRAIAATPHGDAENPDSPYAQHGCESCHGPGSFHVSRAHGGRGLPKMVTFGSGANASDRDAQLAVCQACHHERAAGRAAIRFTDGLHDIPYVTCSTCHVVHAAVNPLAEPASQAEVCFACHRSQREGHPLLAGREVDFSRRACARCHRIHPRRVPARSPVPGGSERAG